MTEIERTKTMNFLLEQYHAWKKEKRKEVNDDDE